MIGSGANGLGIQYNFPGFMRGLHITLTAVLNQQTDQTDTQTDQTQIENG